MFEEVTVAGTPYLCVRK